MEKPLDFTLRLYPSSLMPHAEVLSQPAHPENAAADSPHAHVLILHEVADYLAWKAIFDEAATIRREAGERSYQVLHYASDPRKIVHFSQWTSIADARSFFESPRLVKIRHDAGVKAPEFIYLHSIESGRL